MKAYTYKDSGIEWLGKIPSHWKADRLRDLSSINTDALSSHTDENLSLDYLDIRNVNSLGIVNLNKIEKVSFKEAPSRARRKVEKFDTVISSVRTNLQAVAFVDFDKDNLICSTGFFVCRPKFNQILDKKYLYYFLLTDYSKDYFFSRSVGVSYPAIDDYKFSSVNLPLPPLSEQKNIVDFLDKAIARIDRIISVKEEQLDGLNTLLIAKMQEATLKGLDKSTNFKKVDSEWIESIPYHWSVQKVKRICTVFRGKFTHRPRNDPRFYNGKYPFIQTGSITNTKKYIYEYTQTLNELGLSVSQMFPKGTLCMTIAGNIGDLAILNFDACFPDSIVGFNPSWNVDLDFLYYQFEAIKQDFLSTAIVTTQMNLNINRIGNVNCYLPPLEEQKQIVEYLDELNNKVDLQKNNLHTQIEVFKKYRKSLIHECVTGKKQVTDRVE